MAATAANSDLETLARRLSESLSFFTRTPMTTPATTRTRTRTTTTPSKLVEEEEEPVGSGSGWTTPGAFSKEADFFSSVDEQISQGGQALEEETRDLDSWVRVDLISTVVVETRDLDSRVRV